MLTPGGPLPKGFFLINQRRFRIGAMGVEVTLQADPIGTASSLPLRQLVRMQARFRDLTWLPMGRASGARGSRVT